MIHVTVLGIINDTVEERTYKAKWITFQHRKTGGLHLKLWRKGRVVEQITYLRVDRQHWVDTRRAAKRKP